jgi:type IV pilus assembly protein PilB
MRHPFRSNAQATTGDQQPVETEGVWPRATPQELVVDPSQFARLSAATAVRWGVAPLRWDGDALIVAVPDTPEGGDLTLHTRLERTCGCRVALRLAAPQAIQAALRRAEADVSALQYLSGEMRAARREPEPDGPTLSLQSLQESAHPVVRLIDTLLLGALARRASDIHLEAYERGVLAKYRIDGVLYPAMDWIDAAHHAALTARLKVMAELDIAERRVPQDGRFTVRLSDREVDCRLSVLPAVHGEDVVIRLLDKTAVASGTRRLSLDALGLSPTVIKRLRKAVREPYGMVLMTGPTGSGKTTTLYAAMSELDASEEKIITIEDPVEYRLDGVVQIPVNEKKGLTFARGLRSILRHDPDKIMVGEIRDQETALIAVQSALTGHLVLTTVHANNAFDVIGRFSHMNVDVYGFVSALNCVVAQRLVRLICPHCRRAARVDEALLEAAGLSGPPFANVEWQEGAGCEHCTHTGYRGRVAVAEVLQLSPRLRQLIVDRQPGAQLQAAAREEGMVTLREAAVALARAGETTIKEINRVTFVD